MPRISALALTVVLLALFSYVNAIGVISIDFGSEWLKMGLVKRGVPADIILNAESKRKTDMVLHLGPKERTFGAAAAVSGLRFPEKTFGYLLPLVGQMFEGPIVQNFIKRFPQYKLEADSERGTVIFLLGDEKYAIEELIAMQLEQARNIATAAAEETMNDAVITVPSFFTQAERRTLLQSARIIGLNVLALVNDNTAVATSWGIFNKKKFEDKPLTVMFYDMGASTTSATIVKYSHDSKKIPGVKILATSFDRTLGGLEFDFRLRDHLVKIFNEQQKGKIDARDYPRALAKLLKEARRVKEVLSANTDTFAQVEGVLPDVDFKRTPVSRVEFETLCTDLFERTATPMANVLQQSGMGIAEIDQVIMFGGAQRMPRVQDNLLKVTGGKELSRSINADEACAIGAVLRAATHSSAFRMAKFTVEEANVYPVKVAYPRAEKDENAEEGVNSYEMLDKDDDLVWRSVIGRFGKYPESKIFSFTKHTEDFSFKLQYSDLESFLPSPEGLDMVGSTLISSYNMSGLKEAYEEYLKDDKHVFVSSKIKFRMDESNVLKVESANAYFNTTIPELTSEQAADTNDGKAGIADKMKNFFGMGGDDEKKEGAEAAAEPEAAEKGADTTNETKDEEAAMEDAKDNTKAEDQDTKKKPAKTKVPKAPKVETVKVALKITETHHDLAPLTTDRTEEYRQRLADLTKAEAALHYAMKQRHTLESMSYDILDKLEMEDLDKVTTEEQREGVRQYVAEVSDWLYGDGEEASAEEYTTRIDHITDTTKPFFFRRDEYLLRPKAVKELNLALKGLDKLLKDTPEDERYWTKESQTLVESGIADARKWLDDKVAAQEATSLTEIPVVLGADILRKAKRLSRDVKALKDTPKPTPVPTPTPDATPEPSNDTETVSDGDGDAMDDDEYVDEGYEEVRQEFILPTDEEVAADSEKAEGSAEADEMVADQATDKVVQKEEERDEL
ncbi:hypothetical protein SARC_03005 [Sphaeroforma arctica JP610]|uniref:Uncharacterized protein n=1 Tax=Sphaeroforma arctica JP610 TaxID=667725 RepID=A0A0L0G6Z1_9EUKA|nr:hypothetical protein SARC_03005 [Sphaeroforma arctica JP610]KNC84797.1 hypothetical protein SARC_03005 [Sphaeroforma arctica JP610]|eukprot:XP_014158699.1 hypothetical protein SARC_03005 [Sphaeroforma arctica JP610]